MTSPSNGLLVKDSQSIYNWGSEYVMFFRHLIRSPAWHDTLMGIFLKTVEDFHRKEETNPSKSMAVLSVIGGHVEMPRVGGRYRKRRHGFRLILAQGRCLQFRDGGAQRW